MGVEWPIFAVAVTQTHSHTITLLIRQIKKISKHFKSCQKSRNAQKEFKSGFFHPLWNTFQKMEKKI